MANIIDETYFKGIYFLDTDNSNVVAFLTDIIEQVEAEVTQLITYDVQENINDIETMLVCFVFALYKSKQKAVNTALGDFSPNIENGITVNDLSEAYASFNRAVSIFNTYVTDSANEYSYINQYGI